MKRPRPQKRDSPHRQRQTPSELRNCRAVVIGLNGIGRCVAAQLASLGIGRVELIDSDTVQAARYAREGYFADDIGRLKIHATAELCHRLNPLLNVEMRTTLDARQLADVNAVFCCTKSARERQRAWQAFAGQVPFFACAAVRGSTVELVIAGSSASDQGHVGARSPKRLALPKIDPAKQLPPSLLPVNCIAASLMAAEFLRLA